MQSKPELEVIVPEWNAPENIKAFFTFIFSVVWIITLSSTSSTAGSRNSTTTTEHSPPLQK